MNDSTTILHRARLTMDPKSRQVGDKTFLELNVATNTYGAKAKERYVDAYFYSVTVTGGAVDRLSQLRKGDTVSVIGTVEEREYKGKIYKDIPFAQVTVQQAKFLSEPHAEVEPPHTAPAPVNTKGSAANPFADNDLPF